MSGKNQCVRFSYKTTLFLISLVYVIAAALIATLTAKNNYNSEEVRNWVLVGGLQPNVATFRVRIDDANDGGRARRLVVSTGPPGGESDTSGIVFDQVLVGNDLVETVTVSDLNSGMTFYYWTIDQNNVIIWNGSFRTPEPEGSRFNFTLATAGCAETGSKAEVFNHIADEDPLLFLHLGDMHYEDINANDVELRIGAFDKVMGSPTQAALLSKTGLVSQWDDHDFLGNESRGYCPLESMECQGRKAALSSYQIALPHYSPLPGDATYQAFTIGTVRFIVSDLRSEQSEEAIYSEVQKAWLVDELSRADDFDFVVWVTPAPWIGQAKEDDNWFNFPNDRAELSDYISQTLGGESGPQNLLALSADAHMVAFDDGRNTYYGQEQMPRSDARSFPMLMSGPLDRLGSAKGGPFSEGCHAIEYERNHQYSTLDFVFAPHESNGDGKERACIEIRSFQIKGSSKHEIFSKRLCDKIFQGTEESGTGSCVTSSFSTLTLAVITASGAVYIIFVIMSCRLIDKKFEASKVSFMVFVSLVSQYGAGIFIPHLGMAKNIEILPIAIIALAYSLTVGLFFLWNNFIGVL